MCTAASFIQTRNGDVNYSKVSDSHSDIIEELGIADNHENIVRLEISPDDSNYLRPFSEWTFKVDQDMIPDWFDQEKAERKARAKLKFWAKYHLFIDRDGDVAETRSLYVYGQSNVTIESVTGGGVRSLNESKITIESVTGGDVESRD